MKKEEYKKKKKIIDQTHKIKLNNLAREYAKKNNPVKIGDIITSNCDTIRVDWIGFKASYMTDLPMCIYSGPKLTKKGVPFKKEEKAKMAQDMLKTINGEVVS